MPNAYPRSTDASRHDSHGHKWMMYVLPWCGDTKRVNTHHTYPINIRLNAIVLHSAFMHPQRIESESGAGINTPTLLPSESRFTHSQKMLAALFSKKF